MEQLIPQIDVGTPTAAEAGETVTMPAGSLPGVTYRFDG